MYELYYGSEPLHSPLDNVFVLDCTCSLTLSVVSELKFKLPHDHPMRGKIELLQKDAEIVFSESGEELFRGRAMQKTLDFRNSETYVCESNLAYLNDIQLRPYSTEDPGMPHDPAGYFRFLVDSYNQYAAAKDGFAVGRNEANRVRPTIDRENSNMVAVRQELKDKMIDPLGGFVRMRYEGGRWFIDYLADGGKENAQKIEFGVNLVDYMRKSSAYERYTAVIPAGRDGDENPITIGSLPDGIVFEGIRKEGDRLIDVEAAEKYGIVEYSLSSDAKKPRNIQANGIDFLRTNAMGDTLEIKAVDRHLVDAGIQRIDVGDYLRVVSPPHGIDGYFLCLERIINASDPANDAFVLGTEQGTLTSVQQARIAALNAGIDKTFEAARGASRAAKDAAKEAEEKARVFTEQPVPPYSVGDLWSQGPGGDILKCGRGRSGGEGFHAPDWTPASKYTDDALARLAKNAADEAAAKTEVVESRVTEVREAAGAAKDAADAAQATAEDAARSAANAQSEALAAKAAAEAVETLAASAQTEAREARESAARAVSKAEEASKAASDAQDDAADAQSAAQAAKTSADSAGTKATEAKAAADEAKTSASEASTTAAAAKLDAEQAARDVAALDGGLETLSNTMTADYARKTDLTEATASLQSKITQNAEGIESNASRIVAIDETANTAKANAKAAQTAAQAAQTKADAATADAAAAQTAADEAAAAAAAAQSNADSATEKANAAQTAADEAAAKAQQAATDLATAKQNLADVTSRVDATEEEAAAAQAAVETAQTAADEAKANAATAQSTANTAKANAAAAQSTANNAQAVADAAQDAADDAKAAADKAQDDVNALSVRVTKAETSITQNAEAIALAATKEEVNETLGGYYTKEQSDAALKVQADRITSNVSSVNSLGTRMSEVEQTADGTEARLETAESDIATAKAKAATAQSTANTAKANAAAAQSTADTAKAKADEAAVAAAGLEGRATTAETKIQQNADAITSVASRTAAVENKFGGYSTTEQMNSAIQQKADSITQSVSKTYATQATVSAVESTVEQTASGLSVRLDATDESVAAAQSTANTAKANAAAAQSTANTAKANAATAQSTADTAQSTADTARTEAANAAKTATNYMEYSSAGLDVGNKSSGKWAGFRTRMAPSAFQVLDAAGAVLASYGASLVELAGGSEDAVIKFCSGLARIYATDSGTAQFTGTKGASINSFIQGPAYQASGSASSLPAFDGTSAMSDIAAEVSTKDGGNAKYAAVEAMAGTKGSTVNLRAGTVSANGNPLYGAKVLYSNASGTAGTVTLAETAANFAFIDIMYAKLDSGSGGYNVCRVYDPHGKKASFNQINRITGSETLQFVLSTVVISGKSVAWDVSGCVFNVTGTAISYANLNERRQLIYKIVGYR